MLLRSAIKCEIARWFEFPLADQERASLRNVNIDPIIADLVSREALPIFDESPVLDPSNSDLYDLGDVIGLDPEIEEDRNELEDIRFARENLALAREAAEQDLIADELDIDHGMVVPSESNVEQQTIEEAIEDVEEIAPIKKRTRQCYSASQLEILHRELEKGTARKKNADIATEISCLDGAREITTQDVRNWFSNMRCRSRNERVPLWAAGGGRSL